MILPHHREIIAFLPLSDLYEEYQYHARLQVFAEKGRECVSCDRVGTLLILSRETSGSKRSKKRNSVNRIHVDLFTDDFVLMTVDHIVPKALARKWGWGKLPIESLDNKQPMCEPCNGSKDCKLLTVEEMKQRRPQVNKQRTGEEALWSLVPNIHTLLGDKEYAITT